MAAATKLRAKSPSQHSAGALLAAFLRANRARFPTDASFASAVEISAARLSQIIAGKPAQVRPQLAVNVHRETRGAVPGNVLRPDLWRRAADVPIEANQ